MTLINRWASDSRSPVLSPGGQAAASPEEGDGKKDRRRAEPRKHLGSQRRRQKKGASIKVCLVERNRFSLGNLSQMGCYF